MKAFHSHRLQSIAIMKKLLLVITSIFFVGTMYSAEKISDWDSLKHVEVVDTFPVWTNIRLTGYPDLPDITIAEMEEYLSPLKKLPYMTLFYNSQSLGSLYRIVKYHDRKYLLYFSGKTIGQTILVLADITDNEIYPASLVIAAQNYDWDSIGYEVDSLNNTIDISSFDYNNEEGIKVTYKYSLEAGFPFLGKKYYRYKFPDVKSQDPLESHLSTVKEWIEY